MPREIEQRHIDVLRREIIIISARATRILNDSVHLVRVLRTVEKFDTLSGNKEEVQSEAVRQPSLEFGSGTVEDYD